MTKTIKIIVAIILLTFTLITLSLVALTFNNVSHCMQINAPSRIIVYYNSESQNKVFEPDSANYNEIYLSILEGYKQPIIKAITTNKLFKDVKINANEGTNINFSGIKINFVYDTPQAVRYKNKLYTSNDQTYWYQNLIFDIPSADKYQYNTVAIIPPKDASYYVSPFNYSLHYSAYSNFSNVEQIANKLFG